MARLEPMILTVVTPVLGLVDGITAKVLGESYERASDRVPSCREPTVVIILRRAPAPSEIFAMAQESLIQIVDSVLEYTLTADETPNAERAVPKAVTLTDPVDGILTTDFMDFRDEKSKDAP